MRLRSIAISHFKNFLESQTIEVEDDVTCLVGKNESGKTTILRALHRLNPANADGKTFDVTTEYPRWRLSRDRKLSDLGKLAPISAKFALDDGDRAALADVTGIDLPAETLCRFSRRYDNSLTLDLSAPVEVVIASAARDASIDKTDTEEFIALGEIDAALLRPGR